MRKTSNKLWAVVNGRDEVCWTHGGSSTQPKLMIYDTKAKAQKQVRQTDFEHVKLIYNVEEQYE